MYMSHATREYRFFREHAGYVVGQQALGAWELAKAEQTAIEREWSFFWTPDDDADWSFINDDEYHEVYGCILRDAEGNTLASLWGILDPDRNYERVVQAELALEALQPDRDYLAAYQAFFRRIAPVGMVA